MHWIVSLILAFEKYYSLGNLCLKPLSNSLIRDLLVHFLEGREKFKLVTSRFVVLRSFRRGEFEQSSIRIYLNLSIDFSHLSFASLVCFLVDRFPCCSTFHHVIVYNFSKIILPREKFDRNLKNVILFHIRTIE